MALTENQQSAINLRSSSILVSAGAGSGKTYVLTKRITERLLDENDPSEIKDYLIVTFTKAAAAEMKLKLKKSLQEALRSNPKSKKLKRQLLMLPNARISTIHSFCLDLVRKYFEELSLPCSMSMCDDTESRVMLEQCLAKVLEDKYEQEGNNDFLSAVEVFSGAVSDKRFAETIIEIYNTVRSFPYPIDFIDSTIAEYEKTDSSEAFMASAMGEALLNSFKIKTESVHTRLTEALDIILSDNALTKSYGEAFEDDLKTYDTLKQLSGYDEIARYLSEYSPKSLKPLKNFDDISLCEYLKSIRASAKDTINDLKTKFFSASSDQIAKAAKETARLLREIRDIIYTLDNDFSQTKLDKKLLDFADLEKFAFRLLVKSSGEDGAFEKTEIAHRLSLEIEEIYIDEYQDVNPLQDMIFRALSRYSENGEHNRFMVGDIKQSIYGFRGATPNIFNRYKERFCDKDVDGAKQKKVFLSNNFRCSRKVINLVNILFGDIMKDSYQKEEHLIFSRSERNEVSYTPELMLTIRTLPEDEQFALTKEECEATNIARRILEIVDNEKYTNSDGEKYTFKDIAILLRSTSEYGEILCKILEKHSIPVKSERSESLFARKEVLLVKSLLFAIDNPERDISLCALMRSVLYMFSDDELYLIRRHSEKDDSFYSCVKNYVLNGEDRDLKDKALAFTEDLKKFRKLSQTKSSDKLLWYLYTYLSVFAKCTYAAFGNNSAEEAETRKQNLLMLYDIARAFEAHSFKGLSEFCGYLDECERQSSFQSASSSKDNYVKVMTIHHSKGLEFPVCFVAGLSKKFNLNDEKKNLIIDKDFGIGIRLRDVPGNLFTESSTGLVAVDTPFRQAIIASAHSKLVQEEMRILYVALTRAKDMLILSSSYKSAEALFKTLQNPLTSSYEAVSYDKWIFKILQSYTDISNGEIHFKINDFLNSTIICDTYTRSSDKNSLAAIYMLPDDSETERIAKIVKRRTEYKISPLASVPSKISVSDLKDDGDRDEVTTEIKEIPDFMRVGKKRMSYSDIGTAHHLFMQFADFEKASISAEDEAIRLKEKGFIDEHSFSSLNFEMLDGFFRTTLYLEIKNSKSIYREMRFNLAIPASEMAKDPLPSSNSDDFVLVQGVIDCFFENPDGTYTVVDFKTDRVNKEDGENVLRERHSFQLRYYCRAVSEITGKKVSKAVLFSFSLMKEIEISL